MDSSKYLGAEYRPSRGVTRGLPGTHRGATSEGKGDSSDQTECESAKGATLSRVDHIVEIPASAKVHITPQERIGSELKVEEQAQRGSLSSDQGTFSEGAALQKVVVWETTTLDGPSA